MKCIACKLAIEPDAWKCIHCDTIQNWRRYLTLSNSVLALLVALLSVSTVLVPLVYNTFFTRTADMRFEILAVSSRIGGHTKGANEDRQTHSASFFTRLSILVMNARDNVGLLKKLCVRGTITYNKTSTETRYCAYIEEKHRVYTKGNHRVLKPEFVYTHRDLPKVVNSNKEGQFQVGPADFEGKLVITFDNEIGESKKKEIPLNIQGLTFTRS